MEVAGADCDEAGVAAEGVRMKAKKAPEVVEQIEFWCGRSARTGSGLAATLGVTYSTLWRWQAGKVSPRGVNAEKLIILCRLGACPKASVGGRVFEILARDFSGRITPRLVDAIVGAGA